ncbi:MAG: hypothetical protein ACD_3C00184G0003 [uncultured bacterium (gcode 4)]|uniref:Uncharacterized protein n=1 Tax=uncultured bacterium (gcode 4) TaxID=1234023 RepID=K2G0F0_9BACT|nr:MAG: hypothetical protein ACD_3C00184G0003 [uncultured bacterium (gcode 4)]
MLDSIECTAVFENFNLKRWLLDLERKHWCINEEYDALYLDLVESRKKQLFRILSKKQ